MLVTHCHTPRKTQTSFAWSSAAQVVNSTTQVLWCLSMTPWCAASRCWSLWRRSEKSIARSQTDLAVQWAMKDLTWCFYKLLPSAPRHVQACMRHMHAKEASTSGKGLCLFNICGYLYLRINFALSVSYMEVLHICLGQRRRVSILQSSLSKDWS